MDETRLVRSGEAACLEPIGFKKTSTTDIRNSYQEKIGGKLGRGNKEHDGPNSFPPPRTG
jgi:hypothetical protein